MKIQKSTWLPVILAIYLAVMASIGYKGYQSGQFSALYYFGIIALTTVIIILLHFNLKKRERLRKERQEDMENSEKRLR